jgi:hypothetical protein
MGRDDMMDYQIDMGEHGYRIGNTLFGSAERAEAWAINEGMDVEKCIEYVDTRPEMWRVAGQLDGEERVWDEGGIHIFPGVDREEKWPEGRIHVFVETGGSEGLYLHVEVKLYKQAWETPETRLLLIAKTLDCSTDKWYECWMSAARIARLLGA